MDSILFVYLQELIQGHLILQGKQPSPPQKGKNLSHQWLYDKTSKVESAQAPQMY